MHAIKLFDWPSLHVKHCIHSWFIFSRALHFTNFALKRTCSYEQCQGNAFNFHNSFAMDNICAILLKYFHEFGEIPEK